ncbi:ankyrin repeat domain-containing protein [Psychrobacillus sp. L4]|uniref:ankyrin repeat domain-containing protein n=1 Tax=Psychrobacillus sp. L4 TaxID=3236892 RepID=UPI0036F2258B
MFKKIWIVIGCFLFLQGCEGDEKIGLITNRKDDELMKEQLLIGVQQGDIHIVRQLIKEGVPINGQDAKGRTALMIATYENDVEIAKVLIDAGADVNVRDQMKNNPFLYAGAEGYLEILQLTIVAGADPTITNRYGGVALIPASEHGYVEVVKELLTNTAINVNHVNNLGWTALLEAIILNDGNEKQQQIVQLLINHGADVNLPDHDKVTPLQHARKRGFKEIEKILLKAGAN